MSASSLDPLISELRGLIDNGDLEDAFERLLNYLPTNASSKLYNEVLGQSARYNSLRRRRLAGSTLTEQANVDENLIRAWLIDFIDRLPSRIAPEFLPVRPVPQVAAEMTQQQRPVDQTTEKILGINNLRQIWWIERGLQVCKSVCRILTPGGLGTGFLVGDGMIMTNNHVIPSAEVAGRSVAEFDYQLGGEGRVLPSFRYPIDPQRFHTNATLDYTLVGLKPVSTMPPLPSWGRPALNPNADPVPTEHVSIVQHPNGGLKQIVVTANWVVATKPPLLHYTTDTMPGSSGSPVFNDTWYVIAIHHSAVTTQDTKQGYANEGILMSAIKADAGAHWPAGG